jgi:hypothetical protein
MTPGTLLALGVLAVVVGIGGAAWVLRWEIRAQRRAHRYGGFVVGGER